MKLIAHRGASKYAPENTLEAFSLAHEMGVPFIECDLSVSNDGFLFIFHDDTLNRTTNGRGSIINKNWATLSQLDAGSWFSSDYLHVRIPSIHDLLEWHQSHPGTINIELKTIPEHQMPLYINTLYECMQGVKDIQNFIFSSFQFELLETIHQTKKNWRIAALTNRCHESIVTRAKSIECEWLAMNYKSCKPSWVQYIHDAGMQMGVYTVNDLEIYNKMEEWGVDFVFSDDIKLARNTHLPVL